MSVSTNTILEPKVGRIFTQNGTAESADTPIDRTITGGSTDPSPVDLIDISDPRLVGLPIAFRNIQGTASSGSITIVYRLIVDGVEVASRTETTNQTGSTQDRLLLRQGGLDNNPDTKFPPLYAPTMKITTQVTANTTDGTMIARVLEFDRIPVIGDV